MTENLYLDWSQSYSYRVQGTVPCGSIYVVDGYLIKIRNRFWRGCICFVAVKYSIIVAHAAQQHFENDIHGLSLRRVRICRDNDLLVIQDPRPREHTIRKWRDSESVPVT